MRLQRFTIDWEQNHMFRNRPAVFCFCFLIQRQIHSWLAMMLTQTRRMHALIYQFTICLYGQRRMLFQHTNAFIAYFSRSANRSDYDRTKLSKWSNVTNFQISISIIALVPTISTFDRNKRTRRRCIFSHLFDVKIIITDCNEWSYLFCGMHHARTILVGGCTAAQQRLHAFQMLPIYIFPFICPAHMCALANKNTALNTFLHSERWKTMPLVTVSHFYISRVQGMVYAVSFFILVALFFTSSFSHFGLYDASLRAHQGVVVHLLARISQRLR